MVKPLVTAGPDPEIRVCSLGVTHGRCSYQVASLIENMTQMGEPRQDMNMSVTDARAAGRILTGTVFRLQDCIAEFRAVRAKRITNALVTLPKIGGQKAKAFSMGRGYNEDVAWN